YYYLLKAGYWLAETHPEVESPAGWTRDMAIEYVAAVDRMTVGQWSQRTFPPGAVGKPLAPRVKSHHLRAVSMFFRDCQEWGWIPRHFEPSRCFATPRAIRALIGPSPRVIADDVWAKLLWAGLNLTMADLPPAHAAGQKTDHRYPLEMVRAIVIVWLFAGLRRDEITRLRVGCVRWHTGASGASSSAGAIPVPAVCLLDVPTNKTGTAFTKPVDR